MPVKKFFKKNALDLQLVDLLNNGLLNIIFLKTLLKLSKDLFQLVVVTVSTVQ